MEKKMTVSEYALKRSRWGEFFRRYGMVMLFLAPFLFFFLLFCIYPLLYGIVMSLMRFSISDYSQNEWRGFENFATILFNSNSIYNRRFWYSMGNTAAFAVVIVPLAIIIPLIMAVLINSKPKGYKIFRAIIYLPSVLPVSASGVIFISLFGQNFGYINQWIGQSINWLNDGSNPMLAWFVILLLCLWGGWGGNFIILSAGLKNVDKSLYEAANVDGCTGLRRLFSVTIPVIKQQLILCIFTTIIGYFSLYGQVYVLTNGGPATYIDGVRYESTMTIMWYLQSLINSTNFNTYGMVSAMGLLLGVFVGIITGLQLWLTRERKSGTKLARAFAEYQAAETAAKNDSGAEEPGSGADVPAQPADGGGGEL